MTVAFCETKNNRKGHITTTHFIQIVYNYDKKISIVDGGMSIQKMMIMTI
jgi:hypothetical protein